MHAVILAGGSGTRLRPLTYARRKELMPVLNRPLLEYRIENLREHGVVDIVIACSASARELRDHFKDGSALGVNLRYSFEQRPLGSGRAVKEAARSVGAEGETLVVCNGDILTNIDLTEMLAAHWKAHATMSMSLAAVDDPWNFGVVAVDDELAITAFVEKPPQGQEPSNLINAGTWLWEPEVLERIPDDESAVRDQFAERELFPGLIADGLRLQGFEEDLWVDVGAPDRYLRANALLLERLAAQAETSPVTEGESLIAGDATFSGLVFVSDDCVISRGATIKGPTVIGPHCQVGAGATVEGCVLWERVNIGPDASVSRSILADGVRIGREARVSRGVIASGASVPDGARLADGATLAPNETAQ